MRYIIGVDAGGTKTIAAVYNPEGFRLDAFSTGPGNGLTGGDGAAENILAAVRQCMEAAGGGCAFVGVGMAGTAPMLQRRIQAELREGFGVDTEVTDDGTLALYAAHGGGDGLLVVAGTGSIAWGKRGSTVLRRGGWGHILGDRGSGYAIAADAIRLALDDLDAGLPDSTLTRALLEHIGGDAVRRLVELVYGRPKAETAALTGVVADFAGRSDQRAAALLKGAGEELADMAAALAGRLGLVSPAVALSGGVLHGIPVVRDGFRNRLRGSLPGGTVSDEEVDPPKGALYLYRQRTGVNHQC